MAIKTEVARTSDLDAHISADWKLVHGIWQKVRTQESWIAPTFLNSWVNCGGTLDTVGYMKDSMGFVHLKGCMKNGAIGQEAFRLPSGYISGKHQSFAVISSADGTNIIIGTVHIHGVDGDPPGRVWALAGGNNQFYLDGVIFKAEL